MKKPLIEDLLMSRLFAPRKDLDANDWATHVKRNLVNEVRAETLRFYGPADCIEAQYPGLDYNDPAHRIRLSQFPCHRRLFRAFDQLRLTDGEIQRLCKWEGTRHARETYEVNNKTKIRDTTWDGMPDARHKRTTATSILLRGGFYESLAESPEGIPSEEEDVDMEPSDLEEEHPGAESEDEMHESIGVELNRRLIAATEARARGEDVIIDADWEQWLKEAAERGIQSHVLHTTGPTPVATNGSLSTSYWDREVPDYSRNNPTVHRGAMQTSLAPPPQYSSMASANDPHPTVSMPVT